MHAGRNGAGKEKGTMDGGRGCKGRMGEGERGRAEGGRKR